ncbi:cupin domain-containing protein [Pendulispora rubella]|uniref:Cupin domain-containing protein n=1 Tax=Pendulispora rubella TaxID=2741070 RepID=A0ABZ2KXJ6_9BACT
MSKVPPFIVHEDDVPEVEGRYRAPFDGEALSWDRDLGRAAGTVNLGMSKTRLPPGRRTSFTHAHSEEEELVYVVAGECAVRLVEPGQAPREYALRAGHTVAFPAGTGIAHTFVNRGSEDCTLLTIGERKDATDRVFYPEEQDAAYEAHMVTDRPGRHWKRV